MVKHCVNDGKERKIEINSISRMLNGVNFYWIKRRATEGCFRGKKL